MKKYSGKPASSFKFRTVLYEKRHHKAVITLNRPEVHNALNFQMLVELGSAFQDAAWDDEIGVVILTGAGEKSFCTGADIKEWGNDFLTAPGDFYKWMGVFTETFDRLRTIGKPTIARLNGMVVGGGNELQISCDLAIAADDITIRHIGVSRGSVPGAGAAQWLPLIIGDRRARQMLYLCEEITAQQALDWGLINQAVPRRDLDGAVDVLAEKLLNKLPECLRFTKQQLNFWREFSWGLTIGNVRDWLTVHTSSAEVHEGLRAFMEKRPVDYKKLRSGRSRKRR